MDKKLCIFHNKDHDGHCSAKTVKRKFRDVDLVGLDYGDQFPWEKIKDHDVIMVDFSISPPDMRRLAREARHLTWIDHHRTAIKWSTEENFTGGADNVVAFLNTSFAACELTWFHFFPGQQMPRFIHHVGRYDIWDHTDPETVSFHHGLLGYLTNPELDAEAAEKTWNTLFSDNAFTDQLIKEGEVVKRATRVANIVYARRNCFETTLAGLPVVAINREGGSELFEGVFDSTKHKMMVVFGWRNGLWDFSLRSEGELDVSAIAAQFGGGGLKNAAGLQIKGYLPDGFLR